jgi:hypothetical protein
MEKLSFSSSCNSGKKGNQKIRSGATSFEASHDARRVRITDMDLLIGNG